MLKAADLDFPRKLIALLEEVNGLIGKMKMDLSVQEEQCVRQLPTTRAIPFPKLLIKDHKTIKRKGGFPTSLVIPETNFNATISKLGYFGIKIMLDKAKVNYLHVSISQ